MALRKRLASSLGNVMVEGRALDNIIFNFGIHLVIKKNRHKEFF
jgi:hypothetical protein